MIILFDNYDDDVLPFIDDDSAAAEALRNGVQQYVMLSVWFSGKIVPAAKC